MDVDIYDFDKTIIPFDSGSRFLLYCLLHYPWTIIFLPLDLIASVLLAVRIIKLKDFKEICFLFVCAIPLDKAVKGFWDKYEKKVHKWFYSRKRHSVVISASPDFLLEEIQKRLGFETLICSRHNRKTGKILGKNCKGKEKISRFFSYFADNDVNVIGVYSDSLKNDKPIFSLGRECYHIVNGEVMPFDFNDVYSKELK